MNRYAGGYYNLDITEFVATDEWLEEHGADPGMSYKDFLLSFPENSIVYDRSIHFEQLEKARNIDSGSAGLAASHINNRASRNKVAQPKTVVNPNSTTDSDGNQQSTNRNPRESPDIRYSIGRKTDKAVQEMASAYPDVFDAQINAGDMPVALGEIIDRLRNENTSALEYAHSRRWIEQDLIRDVYDSYWRVNNLRTVADRNAVQINRLKSEPKSTSCSCRGLSPGRACKMKENRL